MPPLEERTDVLIKKRVPGRGLVLVLEWDKTFVRPVYVYNPERARMLRKKPARCPVCEGVLFLERDTDRAVCVKCGREYRAGEEESYYVWREVKQG